MQHITLTIVNVRPSLHTMEIEKICELLYCIFRIFKICGYIHFAYGFYLLFIYH